MSNSMLWVLSWWKLCCYVTQYVVGAVWVEVLLLYHTTCCGCCVGGSYVVISHCMLRVLCGWKLCCYITLYVIGGALTHASGSGQLQANPHVVGSWLSPGKSNRMAATTMRSNDLVVGKDHMLELRCQRYNCQTGRCGSIAFGSSPRRRKTLI